MITKKHVVSSLCSRRLFSNDVKKIHTDSIQAISYRDIIELYLKISGQSGWKWKDTQGNFLPPQTFIKNIINIIRDIFLWLFFYLNCSRNVASLKKAVYAYNNKTFKKNTVLFLRTDHWFNIKSGGSVGHLTGVIHGLKASGYYPHIISTDCLIGINDDDYFHLCVPSYERGRNLPEIPELLYNDQIIRFIDNNWQSWSPSFIYQRYSLGNYAGVILRKRYRVPYVCEYNGSFPWMARNWQHRKLFHEKLITRIELLNLQEADVVVVVSQPMKDELMARGIESSKILVNPNGVDPDKYSPGVDGSKVLKQYNLDRKTIIGFIGTFGRWHGAEVLAEAFGRLLHRFPEYVDQVQLFMIGDGQTMSQVKENLRKYNVTDACTFTGLVPQEEGPSHLAACDILVSPHVPNPDGTPFFGSPTKLFEYMAMGKGIVASDLEQIGEVLKHGNTAWMVKPGDPESLMFGLKAMIDDEGLRRRLGKVARQEVAAKYTWKEHTRKIIEKLKECCT